MRAYANTKQNKVLTAEKIIGFAEKMMPSLLEQTEILRRYLRKTSDVHGLKLRHDAVIIPADILQQNLLYTKGIMEVAMNKRVTA